MSSAFKDKLRKIRDASTKRSEIQIKLRSEEDLLRSQKTVQAFEFREAIEAVIEDLVKNFQAEAPAFVLTRGFYEGKYMLALRSEEELVDTAGHAARYYSRLMFLLDPHVDENSFAIQSKKTIRNRDMESSAFRGQMSEQDQAGFATFVEQQFLDFAEHYFGDTSLSKPTGVGS
jgi:hypothetical protein